MKNRNAVIPSRNKFLTTIPPRASRQVIESSVFIEPPPRHRRYVEQEEPETINRTIALYTKPFKPTHFRNMVMAGAIVCFLVVVSLHYFVPVAHDWLVVRIYGYPLTKQVDVNIGQGGTSHLIAINNTGTIDLIIIPPDGSHYIVKSYLVTHTIGSGKEYVPITELKAVNGGADGRTDIDITLGSVSYLLFNDGHGNLSSIPSTP